jgi:hypothetical protein
MPAQAGHTVFNKFCSQVSRLDDLPMIRCWSKGDDAQSTSREALPLEDYRCSATGTCINPTAPAYMSDPDYFDNRPFQILGMCVTPPLESLWTS